MVLTRRHRARRSGHVVLAALALLSCGRPAKTLPDGSLNPEHELVLCATAECTRPERGQTLEQRRGSCPVDTECVPQRCDAGLCEGWCFDGGLLGGGCDAKGCCTFSCGGIVGSQCPREMRCLVSTECCDVPGTCTRAGLTPP